MYITAMMAAAHGQLGTLKTVGLFMLKEVRFVIINRTDLSPGLIRPATDQYALDKATIPLRKSKKITIIRQK